MSEMLYVSDRVTQAKYYVRENIEALYNIKNEKFIRLKQLVESLEIISDYDDSFNVLNSFLQHSNKDIDNLSHDILLMALFYRVNNLNGALKFINNFLDRLDSEESLDYLYFYSIRDFLKLRLGGLKAIDIKEILFPIYGEDINEVIDGFDNPKEIFREYSLPACFNCETCQMYSDCKFFHYLTYAKRLQEIYKNNIPDQLSLNKIFVSVK